MTERAGRVMVRWPIRAHSSSVRRASRSTSKIPRFRYSGRGRPTGRAILGVLRRAALLRTRLCVIREATMFSSVSFVYPGASSRCRMFSSDCIHSEASSQMVGGERRSVKQTHNRQEREDRAARVAARARPPERSQQIRAPVARRGFVAKRACRAGLPAPGAPPAGGSPRVALLHI